MCGNVSPQVFHDRCACLVCGLAFQQLPVSHVLCSFTHTHTRACFARSARKFPPKVRSCSLLDTKCAPCVSLFLAFVAVFHCVVHSGYFRRFLVTPPPWHHALSGHVMCLSGCAQKCTRVVRSGAQIQPSVSLVFSSFQA